MLLCWFRRFDSYQSASDGAVQVSTALQSGCLRPGQAEPLVLGNQPKPSKKVNANANTLSAKVASLIVIAKAKASAFAANEDFIAAAA